MGRMRTVTSETRIKPMTFYASVLQWLKSGVFSSSMWMWMWIASHRHCALSPHCSINATRVHLDIICDGGGYSVIDSFLKFKSDMRLRHTRITYIYMYCRWLRLQPVPLFPNTNRSDGRLIMYAARVAHMHMQFTTYNCPDWRTVVTIPTCRPHIFYDYFTAFIWRHFERGKFEFHTIMRMRNISFARNLSTIHNSHIVRVVKHYWRLAAIRSWDVWIQSLFIVSFHLTYNIPFGPLDLQANAYYQRIYGLSKNIQIPSAWI